MHKIHSWPALRCTGAKDRSAGHPSSTSPLDSLASTEYRFMIGTQVFLERSRASQLCQTA